jgi:hypothetical protein
VTLDLNEFTVSCSATPNAATAIAVTGSGATVMNGLITGFGAARRAVSAPPLGWAINFQPGEPNAPEKVVNMHLDQNGNGVYEYGALLDVTDTSVANTLGTGIQSETALRLANSSVSSGSSLAAGTGVSMNVGSVTGCTIQQNFIGITTVNANITNNYFGNNQTGIACQQGWTTGIGGNTFAANGADTNNICISMKNNVSGISVVF